MFERHRPAIFKIKDQRRIWRNARRKPKHANVAASAPTPPPLPDLTGMTNNHLRSMAKELGAKGTTRWKKDALVAYINENWRG